MAQWLVSCGVTTVAMESTGVYWIPPYDVLERHFSLWAQVEAKSRKSSTLLKGISLGCCLGL
jgi:hypothetical protein